MSLRLDGSLWTLNTTIPREPRSLKFEEVYIKSYTCVTEAMEGISNYIDFYNHQCPHQSLSYLTPAQVHFS